MRLSAGVAGRAMAESMAMAGVIIADDDLRILHIDGEIFARHGRLRKEWRGRLLADALGPAARAELEPRCRAALSGESQSFDHSSVDTQHPYWVRIAPVRGADGAITSLVAVFQDMTDRLRVTAELARSVARLRETEHLVGVGSWELTLAGGAITYSDGFARILGLAPGADLDLATYAELVHPDDRGLVTGAITDCAETGSASCEYRIVRPGGGIRTLSMEGVTVSDEKPPGQLRGAILDVTAQRRSEQERVEALSLFEQGFDAAPIGMVLTDPVHGRYVRVNDAMCRLLGRSREQLLQLRVDEIIHPDDGAADADARQAVLDGRSSHFETEKRYLRADASAVWVAVHVAPVRHADGSVRAFFSQVIDITGRKERDDRLERNVKDAVWLGRIRDAIDQDRLMLYSQPIIELATGRTVQHELLLRMTDENGSVVAPGDFLPIAERYGLISEIDRWVIRQAAAVAATGMPTEFNVSAMSIGDPDVLRELETAIADTGADPSLLVVEVTETAIADRVDAGRAFAEGVRALGCGLALDDFGTGFASLSYLKHIPAQHLKIDIDFVRDLTHSDDDERLVRGIVSLAREFDQTTTAEGVENEETVVRLRELGVDRAQGYFFGRPQPLDCGARGDRPATAALASGRARPGACAGAVCNAPAGYIVDAVPESAHTDAAPARKP